MEECAHRPLMPPSPTKENRGITPEWKKR